MAETKTVKPATKPAKAAPAETPATISAQREAGFHERIAANGSGAASEDAPNSARHVETSIEGAVDPLTGAPGKAKGPDRSGPLD